MKRRALQSLSKKSLYKQLQKFVVKSFQYDIIKLLFGETGENPVRARRRDVHINFIVLTRCRKSGKRSLSIA